MTLQALRICDIASAGTFYYPYYDGGGGQKGLSTSFFILTSTNVGIIPKNYLQLKVITFSYNPFTILVQHFKAIPSAGPKLLNLNLDQTSKTIFRSNSYKSEVMITSLIEMLELPNFGQMTTSAI